ncbi:acyl-CoA carboxylase epsilon subunit-like protein [Halopolyspora algeriensis]|uniref:Acyl-CoA carboxylase epsilon subunit-like protein n=1 Tax=Halopolyspora algeriensis TaxID=1500506 RepID=A0A368VDF5_9ACTN|nr:acyl-CoA carboxylase epsilon subunit [Halopolyspora algeriensis]RCW39168.1 acyl-CoA carboxylase epsilon subunit-like protein [Halopolyspora algeriensis]TQM47464.1 acyl-CoA carboxylase epsilon subunit-like protein [Halopolyspora algeriensis]
MSDENTPHDEPQRPVLRIVRGDPDEAEIAALTAALTGAAAANAAAATTPRPQRLSMWADRSAALRHPGGRRPLHPGPNAWRASTLPG